jgi:glycosyltransferase involved in cell wall biosynthesis
VGQFYWPKVGQNKWPLTPSHGLVKFIVRPPVEVLHACYSLTSALVFPSLAEGFGWPIIEAMACGSPVLTTNDAPMTEAGGTAAIYLPVLDACNQDEWAEKCADILISTLNSSEIERERIQKVGFLHSSQFDGGKVIDSYLRIYSEILQRSVE